MWSITHKSGKARVGLLKTPHGTVETPFFMPVATKGTGKYVTSDDYLKLNAKAIICNAFLLSLRPGVDIIKKLGGIHRFMNFPDVIFTDCGAFQMLRSFFIQTSKRGIHFRSPFDGTRHIVTPETIMETEILINADVAMALDHVPPHTAAREEIEKSVEKTTEWMLSSKQAHDALKRKHNSQQLLFGIAQGGTFPDLREKSIKAIRDIDFDGFSIGGLAIGETKDQTYSALHASLPHFPEAKPKYFMGLGTPLDIIKCIGLGIDIFDSIYPTQTARHNYIYTMNGKINLAQSQYKEDSQPLEKDCKCHTCKHFTRAYLHHISKHEKSTAHRLRSIHNLYFLQHLLSKARDAIKKNQYEQFAKSFEKQYS